MSPDQKRVYILADNKLAQNAGWDDEILAKELQFPVEADIDLDIGVIGFETHEIDCLIEGLHTEEPGDPRDDALPRPPKNGGTVSKEGDLWILGDHRLLCADATKPEAFERLMQGDRAQMVFTDPPYNVPIAGHVSGLGRTRHDEFAMASGEMTRDQFASFLETVFGHLARHSIDGSIHFICMDWRHMQRFSDGEILGELKQQEDSPRKFVPASKKTWGPRRATNGVSKSTNEDNSKDE